MTHRDLIQQSKFKADATKIIS